ncbi:MAG: methyl-accepting chemotaxis protein [Selenomonadaceae bacterium]|nr:methyl-accepting chemotaxis protein [Selenomonadaceae bacterium]
MSFLNSMKVKWKLLSLCVIAAIGLLFMVRSSYVAMQDSKTDMDKMFTQNVRALYAIGNTRHAMRYMQGMMLIATSSNDPARIKSVTEKYDAGKKEIESNWAAFEELAKKDPALAEPTANAKKALTTYVSALDESMRLANSNQGLEGRAYYDKNGSAVATALGKHLLELSNIADKAAEDINKKNDEKMDSAAFASITYGVVIVALLIIASLIVTKAITTPLSIIIGSCEKMRDGDFRKPAYADSFEYRDEFGNMHVIFSAMRENIRALMGKIASSTDELSSSAQALTDSAAQSAQASDQVAHSVTNAAGAVVEQQQNVADTMESVDICLTAIDRLTAESKDVAANANQSEQNAEL